jgi:hypothetical protein
VITAIIMGIHNGHIATCPYLPAYPYTRARTRAHARSLNLLSTPDLRKRHPFRAVTEETPGVSHLDTPYRTVSYQTVTYGTVTYGTVGKGTLTYRSVGLTHYRGVWGWGWGVMGVTFLVGCSYDGVVWVTFWGWCWWSVLGVLFFVRVFDWLVFVLMGGVVLFRCCALLGWCVLLSLSGQHGGPRDRVVERRG